jgi:hypothetical protein
MVLAAMVLLISEIAVAVSSTNSCLRHYENAEYDKAVPACRHAADAGDAVSQTLLGEMYDSGLGVTANSTLAAKWWRAASAQGYLPAQNLLASKYYYGGDVFGPQAGWQQDHKKVYELWQQSAHKGVAASQFMLGVLYMDGDGVERSYSEAYAWFSLSLQGGYRMATDALIELSRLITPAQKQAGIERISSLKAQLDNNTRD